MHLEECGEQLARRVREVGPGAALDQRQIGLADALVQLFLDGADDLGLRQLAAEPAQVPLEVAQHQKLLTELHFNW